LVGCGDAVEDGESGFWKVGSVLKNMIGKKNITPVRVAHVVGKVVLGGVDSVVMNYYRHIDRNQVQFDFIMDGYKKTPVDEEIEALGGKIYKVESYEKNMLNSLKQYYQIFKQNQYPIVHCHMNSLAVFFLLQAWRAGIKNRIAHNHSTAVKGEGKRTLIKYLLRPFNKIFPTHYCACSELAGKWLFGNNFFASGKVKLIRNAIDTRYFSYNQELRNRIRNNLGLGDKLIIGHIGRFTYQKNHSFLIEIFNEIYKKNKDTVLMLVGEGELKTVIQQKAEELGLANVVYFMGLRRDVPELMQALDAFILPSYYEGLPVVGVEAQAACLPCFFSSEVTREVQITDCANFLSLEMKPADWAGHILDKCRGFQRKPTTDQVVAAGFDINGEAKLLTDFYMNLLKN
jgi:glycosyltransferase involved in cell wall biosynthesis